MSNLRLDDLFQMLNWHVVIVMGPFRHEKATIAYGHTGIQKSTSLSLIFAHSARGECFSGGERKSMLRQGDRKRFSI